MNTFPSTNIGILLALVVLFTQSGSDTVNASGDTLEVFKDVKEGHEISVGVQPLDPSVGSVHFTVRLTNVETSSHVLDARINLVALNPEGQAVFRSPALNAPRSPECYEANIELNRAGEWTLVIDITTDIFDKITFEMPLNVKDAPLVPRVEGTIIWIVMVGIFASGGTYLWYAIRKTQQRIIH